MSAADPRADPHRGQPVIAWGESLHSAKAAVILAHGRGATARDILGLASELRAPELAYLAPQAAENTWYPHSFLSPIETNEPWLSSALALLAGVAATVAEAGIPDERLYLLGFSQGACLVLEYAARHPRRLGGVFGLSGGLIGQAGRGFAYDGGMGGTPVFLGCSDVDPHIPKERVLESAAVFEGLGADVETRLYPDMGHFVSEEELAIVRTVLAGRAPTAF